MGGPGIALVLGGVGHDEDEYEEESEFDTLAADFERATGVKVKDPSLLVSVLQRCAEYGEDEPDEMPRRGGKPRISDVLGK